MTVEVSPATSNAELAEVRKLFREYASELGIDLSFQGFEDELCALPGRYAAPRGRLLLARVDGAPAGCIALREWRGDEGEVKRLYVRTAYRQCGVGRQLVAAIICAARAEGYGTLLLDTLSAMGPAIALYEAFGFRRIDAYYSNPLPSVVYFRLALKPEK